ncbi:alpha/beta fold hydrolase [Oceanobacillus halophilus]|uniref:Alpha/beta fold hydrolase n=2 Tax=Oceanobacillus halophilus TaxID=930130 RepID=A0A495A1H6_9BACI|nr:alpha/beta fold hydrolase [Oceanobacillus halophilus]
MFIGTIVYFYYPNKAKSENEFDVPTVFIHGYKGTANSFGTMIERFERNGWGSKQLVYYVSSRGRITTFGTRKEPLNQTFVQVILKNNRANFSDSTEWLASVLRHLKANYDITTVNLVGHSMGGIISLKYIMEYQMENYPSVQKFVAIGSPFDGIYSQEYFNINQDPAATDLKPNSTAFEMLQRGKIPEDIQVLNIGSTGDMVSFPESVKAIRKMVPQDQLQEVIIQDDQLGHSELHESLKVDRLIHSFLVKDVVQ